MRLTHFTSVTKIDRAHPRNLAILWMSVNKSAVALEYLCKLGHERLGYLGSRRSSTLDHTNSPTPDVALIVGLDELPTTTSELVLLCRQV